MGRPLRSLFYVCPRTGLLRENKWRQRWRRRQPRPAADRVEIDARIDRSNYSETVRAILGDAEPVEGVGLQAEHEAELLAAWRGE